MIRMTSGVYGARNMMRRSGDEPFILPDKEEARLVARGVAEYVHEEQDAVTDDGPILPQYDVGMTEKQLRGIAAYFCVDVGAAKKKKDIVDLLDAYFGTEDEGDEPDVDDSADAVGADPDAPSLGAEAPTA